jgi:uncharacterized protein YeaO (DUF488 family)
VIIIKRIYDEPDPSDGTRVLVDRIWPRGISKQRAALDLWLKDIAPSDELRNWFGHKPERFSEFNRKYMDELSNSPAVETMQELIKKSANLTLLYSAKDTEHNQAVVLQKYLKSKFKTD